MIKQAGVLIEAFKAILTSSEDYNTVSVVSSAQEIKGNSFPLVIFNYGSSGLDSNETALKSSVERQGDGTFLMKNNFVYNSSLEVYSKKSLDSVEICEILLLGSSSENFLQVIESKAETAKITPPGILEFTGIQQLDDVQVDETWLHRTQLSFNFNFIGKTKTRLPCFQRTPTDTYPKFKINVEQQGGSE